MSSLKLYGSPFSSCTQRCLLVLDELNLNFDFVVVNLQQREHKKAEFLGLQPFGKVPVLEDGPFILYESRAIVSYLVRKYGNGKLLPGGEDVETWARFDQFASIEATATAPEIANIIMHRFVGPSFFPDFKVCQETVDKAVSSLSVSFGVLNEWLATHSYLSGSTYTTVDIFFSPAASLMLDHTDEGKQLLATRPHLRAYLRRVTQERPAWKRIENHHNEFIALIANLKQRQAASSSSSTSVHFQPKGFTTVLPYIIVKDCVSVIDYYKDVFAAQELFRMLSADKKTIIHAELKFGSSVLMLSEESDMWKTKSPIALGQPGCALVLYDPDVDAVVSRARRHALTKLVRAVQVEFWGDRMGSFVDPFGHSWSVSTHVKDVDFATHSEATTFTKTAEEEKTNIGSDTDAKVSWKPSGKPELMPHLYLMKGRGVEQMEFYVRVFGATQRFKMMSDDIQCVGSDSKTTGVMHGELQFGDMVVMCSENCPLSHSPVELGGSAVSFIYFVKDVDSFVQNALKENGVTLSRPAANQFYGARAATLKDPFGYEWTVQTQIENVSVEQLKQRGEQMAAQMTQCQQQQQQQ